MARKFFLFLFSLLLLAALRPPTSTAEMKPVPKLRAGLPPMEVLETVIRHNQQTVAGLKPDTDLTSLATPHLTWLADADARVRPQLVVAAPGQEVYTVRNLGNQMELSQGAIDYGVRHLRTPVLLITGNSDSLAIRLFSDGYQDVEPAIRKELDHLHLPLTTVAKPKTIPRKTGKKEKQVKKKEEIDPAEQQLRYVEANVDYQVEQAMKRYQDRIREGRLVVVGSVLDLANAYGRGAGRLIIINVNNERGDTKLKKLRMMVRLEETLLSGHIGRQRRKPASSDDK